MLAQGARQSNASAQPPLPLCPLQGRGPRLTASRAGGRVLKVHFIKPHSCDRAYVPLSLFGVVVNCSVAAEAERFGIAVANATREAGAAHHVFDDARASQHELTAANAAL